MRFKRKEFGIFSRAARLFLAVGVACLLLAAAVPAKAQDIELQLSADAIERFFKASSPFHYNYELFKGQNAADIILSNPRLLLTPGTPGNIRVRLDYRGESELLGLEPFTGTTDPEVVFSFDPQKQALRISLKGFQINAGDRMKIRLDNLLQPAYLPLTSPDPIDLGQRKLKAVVSNVRTSVTKDGLRISGDYDFLPVGPSE